MPEPTHDRPAEEYEVIEPRSAANVMQRYDLVELLRELTERVDGMSEPEITLGTGDDACVMDWHAFDGEFYRATIERIEP